MRRWAPMLGGLAGAMAFLGVVSGLGSLVIMPLLLLVPAALILNRRTRTLEIAWPGPGPPLPGFELEAGSGDRDRFVRSKRSVAASLARVEARELLTSPWFGAGIGFWVMVLLVFGVIWSSMDRGWWEFFGLATMMCHPFAGMVVVAAHRNRTRSGRDGCDELFDTCPTDADTRTLGQLGTAWIGSAVCVTGVLGLALLTAVGNPRTYGPIDHEALASVLASAVIGAGAVVLGVTLGRWVRFGLVPLLAVGAIGAVSGGINAIGGEAWATDRLLATFVASPGIDAIFLTRPVWARLGWFAALTLLVATLGLVGGKQRTARVVAAVAAVAAVIAALGVVSPAPAGDAARIADRVADPLANSTCIEISGGTRVCAFEEYHFLATRTAKELEPVAAAVPDDELSDALVLTRFDQRTERLQAEARDRLGDRPIGAPRDAMRLRFFSSEDNFVAVRLRFAAHALGLPTEAGSDDIGTVVAGQARGVLVLWLAVQGRSKEAARDLLAEGTGSDSRPVDATDRGNIWPGTCADEVGVLQWSPTDLTAARAMAGLPPAQVKALLETDWDRFADPNTGTDELLDAVRLRPLGPHEPIEPRALTC